MSDTPNVGKLGIIIPVKTYSKAKSRLALGHEKTEEVCALMLEEVLQSIRRSDIVQETVMVSKDESALKMARRFDVAEVFDYEESGVNHAVNLGDNYLTEKNNVDTSIVIPQDVPLVTSDDIEKLCAFVKSQKNVLVVPSRRFDGTNALLRKPAQIIRPRYDEDSYKLHLSDAKSDLIPTSIVLIRRIMMDVDEQEDLDFILSQDDKPYLCEKFGSILGI